MAKGKQVFFCQECGFESTKWMGQCPGCKAWNSFCEEKVTVGAKSHDQNFKNVDCLIEKFHIRSSILFV